MRPSETLICDTSFVSHDWRRSLKPGRYEHWDLSTLGRIDAAFLAISVVTVGETRAGYLRRNWGTAAVKDAEENLRRFHPLPVRRRYVDEWARLRIAARKRGVAISENDLWIAATASRREQVLVSCDRDHVRIEGELGVDVLYLPPPA